MSTAPHLSSALAAAFSARRVGVTLLLSALTALALSPIYVTTLPVLIGRALLAGLMALAAFGLFEQWPERLPRWLARWVLQVAGVVLAVPLGVLLAYLISTGGSLQAFWDNEARITGFLWMAFSGLVLAVLMAMSALVRQRDAAVQAQQLAFELERSELERRALDARLRLLQAQVEPHFLFNTLANVRALVDAGSPQASQVLSSLIAYLRAAVPRLQEPATRMGQELELVRAYLALMHLRMPDRLQFSVEAGPEVQALRCPTMTLLTLVENAVQHGIDPSEEGGRIEVRVRRVGERCVAQVRDSGVGLERAGEGLGTGLSTLRERLQLAFGGDAQLRLAARQEGGVSAEVEFPAEDLR
jgi:two-component sensor histidine kinase